MDSVQEMIDEHKHEMPTALAKKLLDACKAEAEAKPKLYRVTITRVNAVTWIKETGDPTAKMQHRTQTLLLEYSWKRGFREPAIDMIDRGKIWDEMLKMKLPSTIDGEDDDELTIIHSITPYVDKRSRE
jgi:hypothetical protein